MMRYFTFCLLVLFVLTGSILPCFAENVRRLPPHEAATLLKNPPEGLVVLDVRTDKEFAAGHVPGAVNIDFFGLDFETELHKLNRTVPYLVYCRVDSRSASAVEMMEKAGFTKVMLMEQGMAGWSREQLPEEK